MLQSEAGYIDARPYRQDRGNLLHRTAGPYIGVKNGGAHQDQAGPNVRCSHGSYREFAVRPPRSRRGNSCKTIALLLKTARAGQQFLGFTRDLPQDVAGRPDVLAPQISVAVLYFPYPFYRFSSSPTDSNLFVLGCICHLECPQPTRIIGSQRYVCADGPLTC